MTYKAASRYIVSTDLDGTLLDHHSYEWQAATPALAHLAAQQIPVIINTSKTFEEVIELQRTMNLSAPFIVENGSALFLPQQHYPIAPPRACSQEGYWQLTLGQERTPIVSQLHALRRQHGWSFESFTDMSPERVIALTGLSPQGAILALKRRFSEPLVWQDSKRNYSAFVNSVESQNLRIIRGGRFVHILGQTDKGFAIEHCRNYLESLNQTPLHIIALGDSPNDIDMLKIAHIAVVVRSPTHDYPKFQARGKTIYTDGIGPIGWNQAIKQILQ